MAIKTYVKGSAERLSENFTASEFQCKGFGCCSSGKIDEKLVEILQKIRDHFGKPVIINSGYRCYTHNKKIGGAPGSYHTYGQAADFSVSGIEPAEVAKYAESIGVNGIGLYETDKDGYFVHVDTRTQKSFWYGQSEAYRDTFGGAVENAVEGVEISLTVLQQGSKGENVKALQILLAGYGYPCQGGTDGVFGSGTNEALKKYQTWKGLTADGICGEITWASLLGA